MQKIKTEVKTSVSILSEWLDLNQRPLPPQARLEHFSGHFIFFQTFPLRQKWPFALSWHLVSKCSERVYGRVCGRKNPLPNWWLRPHRSGWFFIKISGQHMWSLSQLQRIKVVVLYLFFSCLSRVFAIKICTAIDKEKAGGSHVHHECTNESAYTWCTWSQLHPNPSPNAVNSQYLIRCKQRKGAFSAITYKLAN